MFLIRKYLIVTALLFITGSMSVSAHEDKKNNDVSFFQIHYLRKGNYKDQPLPGETIGTLKLYAAGGEYEVVQFLMRSNRQVEGVSVAIDKHLKKSSSVIPAKNIDIRMVVDQKRWITTRSFERLPYLLMKKNSFTLKAQQSVRIWVTVKVPKDATPGKYIGTLKVSSQGKPLKIIPIELKVWPFELREINPDQVMFATYLHPNGRMPSYVRNKSYWQKIFMDMKAHGMNSIFAYQTGLLHRDNIELLKKVDMLKKGMKYIWIGAAGQHPDTIRRIEKYIKQQGAEMILYAIDEPNTLKKQNLQRKISKKYQSIAPNVRTATAICKKGISAVGDTLDIWIIEAIDLNDQMKAKAEKAGKTLFSYECRLAPTDPLTSRHYWGYMLWRSGATGAANWAYSDFGHKNRFGLKKTQTSYNPEFQYRFEYVFCSKQGLLPSIGWDGGIREGIDDYRYIVTLEYWIKQAEKQGEKTLALDGKNLLKELRTKINPENYRKAFEKAFSSNEKGSGSYPGSNFDRRRPEPELEPEDYDKLRRKIARQITKITDALSK